MLRLFYLLIMVAASVAPFGCTAPAWWLADDTEANDGVGSMRNLRAGSAIEAESAAKPRDTETEAFDHNAMIESTLGGGAPEQDSAPTERTGRVAGNERSPAGVDALERQVRALGFADPDEEASALAALRAAPPEHRGVLLRTMQAGAAVRTQQERRATSDRRDRVAPTQRRQQPKADATAIAPPDVEIPERLPDVVQQVSHNQTLTVDSDKLSQLVSDKLEDSVRSTPGTTDWQSQLSGAIAALEAELARSAAGNDRATLEDKLRLLQLVADRRDEAIQSRSGGSAVEQEFWSNELYGLATLLDSKAHADAKKRAGLAATHLRQAADRLAEYGGLVVKNLHFCTEVKGYGSFVTFQSDEFRLGQEVLLYCEVENFKSELREKGYHTALKARYEVFNASGERVADKDLGLKDEHCQNRRRDFFVPYFIWMPKQVPPGKYQLKLTLEDVHAGQTAEATIEFEIKGT